MAAMTSNASHQLHGRFLLRLKVLIFPFGRCEGVDESQMLQVMKSHNNIVK